MPLIRKGKILSTIKLLDQRAVRLAAGLLLLAGLTACGPKEKKESGQALASVNGEEITAMQLSEEMQRANVPAAQQPAAKKPLLESLIERQVLLNAAVADKTDRDPKVVQAIERAKAQIIAQAFLQKRVGMLAPPTKEQVAEYYAQHPLFFTQRKQLSMQQLVFASADLNDKAKAEVDNAKSLDEVAAWFKDNNIKFARNQIARTTADLPPELGTKLLAMKPGQLFIIKEGERSVLNTVVEFKEAPVTLETAAPQIEQYLQNAKAKEAATAEIARLRALAKIEYLNKDEVADPKAPVAAQAPAADANKQVLDRGVAGLK
ncbi:peptidyl-prolyl cis-trans isomerase, EpsD family [Duganella sp. FT134W]|uniref:peptidylprolyl isomerase n=1 Tax=Duganella margarita TaxID=2692170 RepID=A0A7X4H2I9_9BURK|nr:peptidyl-prolyl cis-trans isomerase, EpsD family [Duganella margarita]